MKSRAPANVIPAPAGIRDDRVLPVARWVAGLLVPPLLVAFLLLYLWPNNTTQLFAWTIKPRMTALLMGAGYLGGGYFFLRVVGARRWHHVAAGYLPVATFATLEAVATFLHWDRFNHAHPAFLAWAGLYATTPFIVLIVWLLNRRTDPGTPDPDDVIVPRLARWVVGIIAAFGLATGGLGFLLPNIMIGLWPWQLTPLTAHVVAGWFALPGVAWISIARDPRWSATRLPLQSQALSLILILAGVVRAWGDFDPRKVSTWIFIALMGLSLVVLMVLYAAIEAQRRWHLLRAT
jgi:hypothetical protein